jgi:aminoglycoside phosphotransferase (APT) family kinase protein
VRAVAGAAPGLADPMEHLVPAFLGFLGDRLAPARRRVFERTLAARPALRRRQQAGARTLVHGDAHWWNFLYPNDPRRDATRVIDWGSWQLGAPADDLAFALAHQ